MTSGEKEGLTPSDDSSTELFAPGAEEYYRKVLKLPPKEPKGPERLSLTAVCACSHVNNWHVRADHNDTHCAAVDCPCGAFRASSEPEEPPPCVCGHPSRAHDKLLRWTCSKGTCECGSYRPEGSERTAMCGYCAAGLPMACTCPAEDPPLTPEEEEEAPPEEGCLGKFCDQEEPCRCRPPKMLGKEELDRRWAKAMGDDDAPEDECCGECKKGQGHPWCGPCSQCEPEAPEDEGRPPCDHCGVVGHSFEGCPEGEGLEDCVCGHAPEGHEGVTHEGPCHGIDSDGADASRCGCPGWRSEPDFEIPPQPDRRPPYAVSYSVQGHLYEVALPGDATVRAVDGALVIQHHLGPVAGICQVLPVINEESNG